MIHILRGLVLISSLLQASVPKSDARNVQEKKDFSESITGLPADLLTNEGSITRAIIPGKITLLAKINTPEPADNSEFAISGDGKTFAFVDTSFTLNIYTLNAGKLEKQSTPYIFDRDDYDDPAFNIIKANIARHYKLMAIPKEIKKLSKTVNKLSIRLHLNDNGTRILVFWSFAHHSSESCLLEKKGNVWQHSLQYKPLPIQTLRDYFYLYYDQNLTIITRQIFTPQGLQTFIYHSHPTPYETQEKQALYLIRGISNNGKYMLLESRPPQSKQITEVDEFVIFEKKNDTYMPIKSFTSKEIEMIWYIDNKQQVFLENIDGIFLFKQDMTPGEIGGWKAQEILEARPYNNGQRILILANNKVTLGAVDHANESVTTIFIFTIPPLQQDRRLESKWPEHEYNIHASFTGRRLLIANIKDADYQKIMDLYIQKTIADIQKLDQKSLAQSNSTTHFFTQYPLKDVIKSKETVRDIALDSYGATIAVLFENHLEVYKVPIELGHELSFEQLVLVRDLEQLIYEPSTGRTLTETQSKIFESLPSTIRDYLHTVYRIITSTQEEKIQTMRKQKKSDNAKELKDVKKDGTVNTDAKSSRSGSPTSSVASK